MRAGVLRVQEGDQEVERELPTRNGDYTGFYIAVADAIQNGVKFPVSAQDAVDVMTVIELAGAQFGRRRPAAVRADSLTDLAMRVETACVPKTALAAHAARAETLTSPKGT